MEVKKGTVVDPDWLKNGTFVDGYGFVSKLPKATVPKKNNLWSEPGAEEFIHVPAPEEDDQLRCMDLMHREAYETSTNWYIPGHLIEASLFRLQHGQWMNDELVNICLNHLQSLFCGDISKYTTLSLIHISEPTRPLYISYAVFCLKKKN